MNEIETKVTDTIKPKRTAITALDNLNKNFLSFKFNQK